MIYKSDRVAIAKGRGQRAEGRRQRAEGRRQKGCILRG